MNLATCRCLRLTLGLLGLAVTTSGLSAQTTAPVGPDHVVFYTEPNFQGEALVVEAGASVADLATLQRPSQKPWLAAISSVQLAGTATATVFSATGFGGDRLEITRNLADLYAEARGRGAPGTWDRAIASLSVSAPARPPATVPSAAPPPGAPVVVPPPATTEPPPPAVIVIPPRPPPRTVVVREVRPRVDRRTAEMMIQRAYREVLDRPADPEGLRRYLNRVMQEGWSERQVIENLQRSTEARSIKADEAITKLYREVLGRDPDPNGLAHYRAKWRQGWTQGQIRDDLRRSQEKRETQIRAAITRAYREVLGREPDPEGYATYERAMRERGYTERDVRRALMSGDEYKQRKARKR